VSELSAQRFGFGFGFGSWQFGLRNWRWQKKMQAVQACNSTLKGVGGQKH
jgi:hypothetical protein